MAARPGQASFARLDTLETGALPWNCAPVRLRLTAYRDTLKRYHPFCRVRLILSGLCFRIQTESPLGLTSLPM